MRLSERARVVYLGEGRLAARGLAAYLGENGHEFLSACYAPDTFVATIEEFRPNLIVIGPLDPRWRAFDLCRKLTRRWPETLVVIAARDAGDDYVAADAAYVGASACMETRIDGAELVAVIEHVLRGANLITRDQQHDAFSVEPLTPRQVEILRCHVRGLPTRAIAQDLGVKVQSAYNCLAEIRSKLGVCTTANAVDRALRRGMI